MTDKHEPLIIEFLLKGGEKPIWVIRDTNVPLPNDMVSIENADGEHRSYNVESRTWVTAEQGEHSFDRVRLVVNEEKPSTAQVLL